MYDSPVAIKATEADKSTHDDLYAKIRDGRDWDGSRAAAATVYSDFCQTLGRTGLSAWALGIAAHPQTYMPYTPWPLN